MQSQEPFDYNERYGLRKKRSWVGIALITAIVGVGWITWAGLYHSNPEIRVQLISFTVDSDREVSVRYFVERDSAEAVSICTVIARDFYKDIDMGAAGSLTVALLVVAFAFLMRSFYKRFMGVDRSDDSSK